MCNIYQNSSDFTCKTCLLYINFTLIKINECISLWGQAGKPNESNLICFSCIWNFKKYIIDWNIFSPLSMFYIFAILSGKLWLFLPKYFLSLKVEKGKKILRAMEEQQTMVE